MFKRIPALDQSMINVQCAEVLPEDTARDLLVLPVNSTPTLEVIAADRPDEELLTLQEDLQFILNANVSIVAAPTDDVVDAINQSYRRFLRIRDCGLRYQFACAMSWGDLMATTDQRVRFCNVCDKHVYECDSVDEAMERAEMGQCTAIDVDLGGEMLMGAIAFIDE